MSIKHSNKEVVEDGPEDYDDELQDQMEESLFAEADQMGIMDNLAKENDVYSEAL